jgi:hypothetical protein
MKILPTPDEVIAHAKRQRNRSLFLMALAGVLMIWTALRFESPAKEIFFFVNVFTLALSVWIVIRNNRIIHSMHVIKMTEGMEWPIVPKTDT